MPTKTRRNDLMSLADGSQDDGEAPSTPLRSIVGVEGIDPIMERLYFL